MTSHSVTKEVSMNGEQEQPPRADCDGPMGVRKAGGMYVISVATDGVEQRIVCSGFNAWRVLAALAMMLGVRLPRKVEKGIEL